MLWLSESRKVCSPILYIGYIVINHPKGSIGETVTCYQIIYLPYTCHYEFCFNNAYYCFLVCLSPKNAVWRAPLKIINVASQPQELLSTRWFMWMICIWAEDKNTKNLANPWNNCIFAEQKKMQTCRLPPIHCNGNMRWSLMAWEWCILKLFLQKRNTVKCRGIVVPQ